MGRRDHHCNVCGGRYNSFYHLNICSLIRPPAERTRECRRCGFGYNAKHHQRLCRSEVARESARIAALVESLGADAILVARAIENVRSARSRR